MEINTPSNQPAPTQQNQPAGQGASPEHKRRRRGGRGRGGAANKAVATEPQNGAAKPLVQQSQQQNAMRNPAPARAQNSNQGASRPAQPLARPAQPAPQPKPAVIETDNSLQVIARKTSAQKFANFDDYMKAHE